MDTKIEKDQEINDATKTAQKDGTPTQDEVLTDGEILEEPQTNNEENSELEKLTEELSKQKDLLLRTAAEYENFRKRTEKEKTAIYSNAISLTILAILPIADSLDRAIKASENSSEEYKKGLEMINNQFNDSLKSLSVESFGNTGEKFDPQIHNAVSHIDDEKLDENVIAQVFQKGYKINDKIIRHAMVQVAN